MSAGRSEFINPDDFLRTPEGRVWTPERNKSAWEQAFQQLRQALAQRGDGGAPRPLYVVCGLQGAGKTTWVESNKDSRAPCIFFDAALPRAIHRAPLISMAHEAGAVAHAVWVRASLEEALERNSRRRKDERVPEASIRSVAQHFEEPTLREGFAGVLEVPTNRSAD